MEKGGQSIWNWKLWSFAYEIWNDIIEKYTMMTYNNEVYVINSHRQLELFVLSRKFKE